MIRQGIRQFWTTAGTSNYFCMTDEEILEVNRAVAAVIADRGIFIASTPWQWPTASVRQFIEQAADWGVDIVKVQLDWRSGMPTTAQLLAYYGEAARDSPLPLFAYAPPPEAYHNGMLDGILDLPAFVGLKNDTDDFTGHEFFIRTIQRRVGLDRFIPVTGGGLASVLFGHELGVRAWGDVFAWFAPAKALEFERWLNEDRRDLCYQFLRDWEEPMYEQLAKIKSQLWPWAHTVLKLMGHFSSDAMRFPVERVAAEHVEAIRGYLREHDIR